MKFAHISIFCLLLSGSLASSADECSYRIEAHIDAIVIPIQSEEFVAADKVEWAKKELKRVEALRLKMPDCEVSKRISLMTYSQHAIDRATLELEKQRNGEGYVE